MISPFPRREFRDGIDGAVIEDGTWHSCFEKSFWQEYFASKRGIGPAPYKTRSTSISKELRNMLTALKNFNTETSNIEELVAMLTFGNQMKATYTSMHLESPDWLTENLSQVEKRLNDLRTENLEKALKSVQAKREALKSAEEKRVDLAAEEERLLKALGKGGN